MLLVIQLAVGKAILETMNLLGNSMSLFSCEISFGAEKVDLKMFLFTIDLENILGMTEFCFSDIHFSFLEYKTLCLSGLVKLIGSGIYCKSKQCSMQHSISIHMYMYLCVCVFVFVRIYQPAYLSTYLYVYIHMLNVFVYILYKIMY